MMTALHRRLAPFAALALTALQLLLLFGTPVAACCRPASAHRSVGAPTVADEEDCCPPGAHAPGQCPLHKSKSQAPASRAHGCRSLCSETQASDFILGAIAIVPSPDSVVVELTASTLQVFSMPSPALRFAPPDAPPPRLL